MKPEELRIGNLVQTPKTNQNIPVTIINKHVGVCVNDGFVWQGFEEIQPIELNEGWLLKFGFEREDLGLVSAQFNIGLNPVTQDHLFYLIWFKDYKNAYELKGFPFYRNGHFTLKYVHQLQNLYFALTGEELTVNESKDKIGFLGVVNESGTINSTDNLTIKGSKIKNCSFIGFNAGQDMMEGENVTIIGDDIRNASLTQDNVLIINPGNNLVIIGETLFGEKINVKEVCGKYLHLHHLTSR
ncbi:hypothetical protein [Chryseobacterium vrystaatense]|uniref:Uncharacterized protein n=1 Tax=Chryseobacterium vrystaatense TaxID=307480 RepID=A0A1M4ZI20_9FLAO|nr:hypothetical protein [Chryseobacterium vrystaatense]SHF17689.1 hypothetical protein SAMN02787073_1604 [Chryseobacterium vrystaatense]